MAVRAASRSRVGVIGLFRFFGLDAPSVWPRAFSLSSPALYHIPIRRVLEVDKMNHL